MTNYRLSIAISFLLGACVAGDNTLEPELDAGTAIDAPEPTSCEGFAAITEDAPDVGEVQLATRVITPGISYTCEGVTTWTYWARRRLDDGRLGSYGKFRAGSYECAWFDAIEMRTPATGACQ